MIKCEDLFEVFKKNNLTFFSGVPDSTFKDWMKFLNDQHGENLTNIITSIEREAIGWACGYHVATGKTGAVYMQNSGLGNTVNPITSLADPEVYSIPLFLMIGWRGKPEKKDEPQHKKMGRIMLPLLDVMEIPYEILPDNIQETERVIGKLREIAEQESKPVALIVKKGTLEEYAARKKQSTDYDMTREEAIKSIVDGLDDQDIIVSTTGKTSRELFEHRETRRQDHSREFLMVGSMGLASSFGASIALQKPQRHVYIFDGDGAAIMSAGTLSTIGHYQPKNLHHIVFDNHSYDSTGGQPTVSTTTNFEQIATGFGYNSARTVSTVQELEDAITQSKDLEGPEMLIVRVNKGARKDLGRPTTTPIENKEAFSNFLK